jgi:hypothetical protein
MKKALLIGINYLNSNITLNGCIDDIVNMNKVLNEIYKYDQITMLRDDSSNPQTLPTRNNILNALAQLMVDSVNCSEIWIHYSGHGSRIRDTNRDEISGYDSVLVPVDFTTSGFIVDDDIYTIIQHSKCKTIMLFDSCNSGTVVDLPWSYTIITPNTYMRNLNNRNSVSNQQIYMFSGCKDNQTSADTYSIELNQAVGAFTFAFLTCLKNANYQISLLSLYRNICIFLSNQKFTQIPIYSSSSSTPLASTASLVLPSLPSSSSIINNTLSNLSNNTSKIKTMHTNNNIQRKISMLIQ